MCAHDEPIIRGRMRWSLPGESKRDQALSMLPLEGKVSRRLAASLILEGFGTHCGACAKPFSAARKWRGVGRVTHTDLSGALFSSAWLLCSRCIGEMRRNGNQLSNGLILEARSAMCEVMRRQVEGKRDA